MKQTPSQGLKIIEELYEKEPNNQGIKNSLINAYITFGHHDIALEMIADIPDSKSDVGTLKFKAWECHKNDDIEKERDIWKIILSKQYLSQVHNKIDTLFLRSNKKINLTTSDIPLFCVERNEMLRLPFFLEYYRNLGVTQFFFVDNNSNDGSFEFLMEQDDCHVFWTNDSYNASGHGLTWLNHLISSPDILHTNQWYIIADADEFLIYPDCENRKLADLVSYLEEEHVEAVPSFMLDMYPKRLNDNNSNATNFLQEHIYFYNNYQTFYQIESPYVKIAGGIRTKLFKESNEYYVKTALFKKTNNAVLLISSTHQSTPCKTSKITTAFLHYKFSGNLKLISANEMKRKQHSGGGRRYRGYYNGLNSGIATQNLSILEKSTKYQNSQQLVDLELIKDPDEWKKFIKSQNLEVNKD